MLKLQRSQWFGFIGALEWNLHLMTQTSKKEIELVGKSARDTVDGVGERNAGFFRLWSHDS